MHHTHMTHRKASYNVRRLGLRPGYDTVAIWWSSPQLGHTIRKGPKATAKRQFGKEKS